MTRFFGKRALTRTIGVFVTSWLFLEHSQVAYGDEVEAEAETETASVQMEEVTVTGRRKKDYPFRTAQSDIELRGDELRLKISNTLGETLATQPGVHNASFGPGVGLPVLRGLSGIRVKIMEDNISTWDASSLSPDHAIAIEPVLAESIQVLQGPSTIQFGNAAVGGVVAVDTQRIPTVKTGKPLSGSVELRQELVNDSGQTTAAGKLNGELANVGVHIDGFYRTQDDVSIPGCAIDTDKVNEQFGFDASESNTCGFIANSDAEASGLAAGSAITGNGWHIGGSVRTLENDYGIPPGSHTEPQDGGHDHNHNHGGSGEGGEPIVRIDLEQWRYDLSAGLDFSHDHLRALDLFLAHVDYEHAEEEGGVPVTVFENEVTEAKLQIDHSLMENSNGAFGVHLVDRFFSATGAENFVPPSDIDSFGAYALEKWILSRWTLQAGLRFDLTNITQLEPTAPFGDDDRQLFHEPIEYKTASVQLAADYALNDQHNLGIVLGRHQRAPDVVELLAYGPHLATRSFDVGILIRPDEPAPPQGPGPNPIDLPKAELFHSIELSWAWRHGLGQNQLRAFYNLVDGFIYQANTGDFWDLSEQTWRPNCVRLSECLPVYEYTQDDAQLYGFEWQWNLPRWELGIASLQWDLFADYVAGTLDDPAHFQGQLINAEGKDEIPRLPPWRVGTRLEWTRQQWLAAISSVYVAEQDEPGAFETETDSYFRLDADLSYSLSMRQSELLFFVRAKNITDEEIRNATSFLRNFAPEPGRSLEIGLRMDWQ